MTTTTTKDMVMLLRRLADRFDEEFEEGQEVVCNLTMRGMEGHDSIFPIEALSAREDKAAGVVILDVECPKPAGDLIRSMLMNECGRLIQMAAQADIERVKSKAKINTVNIKNGGKKVVMH